MSSSDIASAMSPGPCISPITGPSTCPATSLSNIVGATSPGPCSSSIAGSLKPSSNKIEDYVTQDGV
eukprot:1008322-Ditylum_brightwellii.AAC.1